LNDITDKYEKENNRLITKMIELTQENSKQSEQMLKMTRRITGLTWIIAILTMVMVVKMFWK